MVGGGGGGQGPVVLLCFTFTVCLHLSSLNGTTFLPSMQIRQHENYPQRLSSCDFFGYAAAAKSLQSCLTLRDPIDGSPPGSHPWDPPGKNSGVGCHFLLQCMKVKSESEVAQSCPTLSDPMDCSLPGSSVHGIFQAKVLEWVASAFSVKLLMLM